MAKTKKLKKDLDRLKRQERKVLAARDALRQEIGALERQGRELKKKTRHFLAARQALREEVGLMSTEQAALAAASPVPPEDWAAARLPAAPEPPAPEPTPTAPEAPAVAEPPAPPVAPEAAFTRPGKGVASAPKSAGKRYSYLQDQYEAHLSAGMDKVRARAAANHDLITQFGEDAGYTREQLADILM